MRYLYDGLAEKNNEMLRILGLFLAGLFSILCIGGSLGGGCAFQVVQSMGVLKQQIPLFEEYGIIYGVIMAVAVGLVIIGGIRRIAATAEKIVPTMCAVYVVTAIIILITRADRIGWAIGEILEGAFTGKGITGGVLGVMVLGIKRAAFSNEAGTGSAAIAHSAAKTEHPVREGIVAMLGPFIDTVVICTMTGLVIVITQAYDTELFPAHKALIDADEGAKLTSAAFASVYPWFPIVLAVAVTLFAYSTMISWSYYGERCVTHLLGQRFSFPYKILFLGFVILGSVVSATNILVFSDIMILSMALPNILGALLLSGKVRAALNTYWASYKAGEFKTYNK
jgi:AGCS family alanine or glycine:cation symporter